MQRSEDLWREDGLHLRRCFLPEIGISQDAGAVDDAVDSAESILALLQNPAHVLGSGNIRLYVENLPARFPQPVKSSCELGGERGAAGQNQFRSALPGQEFRKDQTEATRSAGDQIN